MKKKIIYLSVIGGVLIISLIIGIVKINSKKNISASDQNVYALEDENLTNNILEDLNNIDENEVVENEITDNETTENLEQVNSKNNSQVGSNSNNNNQQEKTVTQSGSNSTTQAQQQQVTKVSNNKQSKAQTTTTTQTQNTPTQSKPQESPKKAETKKYGSVFMKNISNYDNSSLSADQVVIYKDVNGNGICNSEDYNSQVKTTSISSSGTTVSGLEVGKYFAQIQKDTKYYYCSEIMPFTISENGTSRVTFTSRAELSGAIIESRDASTGELISGFTYSIVTPKGSKTTAFEYEKGKCYIDPNAEIGTYKITVNQVNPAYNSSNVTKTIDIKPGSGRGQVVFTYTKK